MTAQTIHMKFISVRRRFDRYSMTNYINNDWFSITYDGVLYEYNAKVLWIILTRQRVNTHIILCNSLKKLHDAVAVAVAVVASPLRSILKLYFHSSSTDCRSLMISWIILNIIKYFRLWTVIIFYNNSEACKIPIIWRGVFTRELMYWKAYRFRLF